jgi:hypothetical protein
MLDLSTVTIRTIVFRLDILICSSSSEWWSCLVLRDHCHFWSVALDAHPHCCETWICPVSGSLDVAYDQLTCKVERGVVSLIVTCKKNQREIKGCKEHLSRVHKARQDVRGKWLPWKQLIHGKRKTEEKRNERQMGLKRNQFHRRTASFMTRVVRVLLCLKWGRLSVSLTDSHYYSDTEITSLFIIN